MEDKEIDLIRSKWVEFIVIDRDMFQNFMDPDQLTVEILPFYRFMTNEFIVRFTARFMRQQLWSGPPTLKDWLLYYRNRILTSLGFIWFEAGDVRKPDEEDRREMGFWRRLRWLWRLSPPNMISFEVIYTKMTLPRDDRVLHVKYRWDGDYWGKLDQE